MPLPMIFKVISTTLNFFKFTVLENITNMHLLMNSFSCHKQIAKTVQHHNYTHNHTYWRSRSILEMAQWLVVATDHYNHFMAIIQA